MVEPSCEVVDEVVTCCEAVAEVTQSQVAEPLDTGFAVPHCNREEPEWREEELSMLLTSVQHRQGPAQL